jgi:hypothetical protein
LRKYWRPGPGGIFLLLFLSIRLRRSSASSSSFPCCGGEEDDEEEEEEEDPTGEVFDRDTESLLCRGCAQTSVAKGFARRAEGYSAPSRG